MVGKLPPSPPRPWPPVAMLSLLLLTVAADPAEQFESRVRPALVEHCHKCHAGNKHKGGLRLDSRAAILAGGDTGPAIVPGDPDTSLLIKAIRGHDPDLVMPPTGKLPATVVRDLEAWVRAGAVWPGEQGTGTGRKEQAVFDLAGRKASHWAWQPLHDTPGDLDTFVRTRLRDSRLTLAPPADPAALIRRLAFDLTGLPPTAEEAARFVDDPSPAAYAKLVDQYLASDHFGERWARHWLDIVRYADTKGHEFDHPIPYAWRYRDWVIQAFNRDLSLKQFLTAQIAGDRMGEPLATGFWLLGEELHSPVDVRQDQADRFDNRIDVFGKAVLGLTVACARCHDHKFDAVRTHDYYALFALLEASVPATVRFDADDAAVVKKLTELRGRPPTTRSPMAAVEQGSNPPLAGELVVDYSALHPNDWLSDGPGWGAGPVPAGGVVFEPKAVVADRTAAVSDRLFDKLAIDGPESAAGRPARLMRPGLILRTPDFTISTGKVWALVRGGGASYAAVGQHTLIEGPLHGKLVAEWKPRPGWRWECHDLTDYRGQTTHLQLSPTPGQVLAVAAVVQANTAPPLPPTADVASLEPTDAERLNREYAAMGNRLKPRSRAGLTLWEGTPHPGRVFVRGSPKSPGEPVSPRLLEALVGTSPITSRLQLAEQATDPATSPMTYRTFANRLWHHLFGRGLVPSPDNLGVLGEPPTHPELLDWLASRLVTETPKQVIRRIVLSDTYRQSARERPDAERVDPGNRLLHRQNLRRLEAEAIRDALLSISGRLDRTVFGPPVPAHITAYQDGRGKPSISGPLDGAGRRTIYQSVRRNFLNPFQLTFDAPNPFGPIGRRSVSNVPAQGLALLNDEFVHQQSARWGETAKSVDRMYWQAFSRPPTPAERAACERFLTTGDWAGLAHVLANVKEFVYR